MRKTKLNCFSKINELKKINYLNYKKIKSINFIDEIKVSNLIIKLAILK